MRPQNNLICVKNPSGMGFEFHLKPISPSFLEKLGQGDQCWHKKVGRRPFARRVLQVLVLITFFFFHILAI